MTRDFAPVCGPPRSSDAEHRARDPLHCADANGDGFTIEKAQLPAAGQLGEITEGSVFFNPFGGFLGTDLFPYRARTPSRDVAGPLASIRVNVGPPARAAPNPAGLDNDRDGFFAFQDCNDDNAAIRPGARRSEATTDENCDGTAYTIPDAHVRGVVNKWDVRGSRFTLTVPAGHAAVPEGAGRPRILCKGQAGLPG